jgi:hypothetical protein
METITIISEDPASPSAAFRASSCGRESVGKTPGAALDALTDQMQPSETSTLIVIQNHKADVFFTASQQDRLQELLNIREKCELSGNAMVPSERSELESLIAQELDGTARRAAAMADELGL